MALEKPPPPNIFKSSNWSSRQQHQNSRHPAARNSSIAQNSEAGGSAGLNSFNNTNIHWSPPSRAAAFGCTVASASAAAQAATVVQQASEKVKREREEAHLARKGEMPLKKRKPDDNGLNSYGGHVSNHMTMGNGEVTKGYFGTERTYGLSGAYNKSNSERELSLFEIRNMLVEKAQIEVRKKLIEWSSLTGANTVKKEKEKLKGKETKKQQSVVNGDTYDLHKDGESNVTDKEAVPPMSINVPDPDFHNFDMDRTEGSFGDDQVWAAYDADDGMPRYYARVHKVISLKPFKMRISWLNSRSNRELGPIDWIGSGFAKTCGDFRIGKHETTGTLNSFSHKVTWTKGTRGVICIYPRKGEVWALYRNWSPDWNEHTPNDVIHKYDMVEVLDDFNVEQGVSVVPLLKIAGFRTVFHKHMDPKEVRRIPKEEMFRFSHQVPNYLLTGHEADNAPEGCRELDPAATSLELLQVMTEANEEEPTLKNCGIVEEEMLQSTPKISVDEMVGNAETGNQGEMVGNDGKQTKDDR